MAKRKRFKRKDRTPEGAPQNSAPRSNGPAAFGVDGHMAAYIDADTSCPTAFAMGDGASVELRGRLNHTPSAGAPNAIYIREMRVGGGAGIPPLASPATSHSASATPQDVMRGRSMVAFTAGSKCCLCGFEAFRWQTTCPRCKRDI
jgi:hypothetical protein